MGADGEFVITAVEACPEIEEGPGCVVTGVYWYGRGVVFALWLSSGEVIRGTATHPVWSVDRDGWVAVGELLSGERRGA